jgi:hypothetical protein
MNTHEDPIEGIAAAAFEVAAATASLVSNLLTHVEHLVGDVVADAGDVVRNGGDLWDVTAERAEDIGRAVAATPRFARIAGELLRIIAAYRLHFAVTATRAELRGAAAEAEALEALHTWSAERLYALCVELRGGVLKLGQFVSTRVDLLPDAYVTALSRLQDRVPPVPTDAIVERISDELGAPPHVCFKQFDSEPTDARTETRSTARNWRMGRRSR